MYHVPLARFLSLTLLSLLVPACSTEPVQREIAADPVDMNGNWELDYGSSDNLQAQFRSSMRSLRQQQARAANAERGGAVVNNGGSGQSLYALAQMAELVTQSQLMKIEQDRVNIRVEREDNFSLSCNYRSEVISQQDYGVGRERCFWDGQQLVFEIRLPEGLDIVHRYSVSTSGDTLAVVTSLYSDKVSGPFSVRRIYQRFEPGRSPYNCTETLSRGRVCTTEKQP
ncbi:MAG: hypothetical protein AAF933_11635 [Pseudomonadota bacterium]